MEYKSIKLKLKRRSAKYKRIKAAVLFTDSVRFLLILFRLIYSQFHLHVLLHSYLTL